MMRGRQEFLALLRSQLSSGSVSESLADRNAVSTDLWPRHLLWLRRGEQLPRPAAVVWPEDLAALQYVVQQARRYGVPLVPYGAGSGVVGGIWGSEEHVVVDLKRMNRILEVDVHQRTATVEAGLMGELWERYLTRLGFTQGHFPSSIYCSTVGGWVAARGAGQMSSRYGKIEDQVLGGVVVLGDGSVVSQPHSPLRTQLWDELIGSEGTLGIWAQVTVRIHPLPKERRWRGFSFPTLQQAMDASHAWLLAGLSPAVLRVYDPLDTLLHKESHGSDHNPAPRDKGPSRLAWVGANFPRLVGSLADRVGGASRCIVGLAGHGPDLDVQQSILMEVANRHDATDLGPGPGEEWYRRRYAVSYKMSNALRAGVLVDTMEVACSWDRVLPVYYAVRDAARRVGAQVLAHFSHAYLDGASIYFTYAMPAKRGDEGYFQLWNECLRAAVQTGANVSHHHGVGRLKAGILHKRLAGAGRALEGLRRAYDPDGVLNPEALRPGSLPDPDHRTDLSHAKRGTTPYMAASLVCDAAPTATLGEIEAGLRAKQQTLGPWTGLFADRQVLDVAKQGWMWRYSPQLRVLEPVLIGVDGRDKGQRHQAALAPRSAAGPGLEWQLLQSDVQRVWLRTMPRREEAVCFEGPLHAGLSEVQKWLRDEVGQAAMLQLFGGSDKPLRLEAFLPAGELGKTTLEAGTHGLGALRVLATAPQNPTPLQSDTPLFFAGSWLRVQRLLAIASDEGLSFSVPWMDAVGAAGFLHAAEGAVLDGDVERRFAVLIGELQLDMRCERQSEAIWLSAPPDEPDLSNPQRLDPLPGHTSLRLATHTAELENCTYCPKLCRFSCPVSIGSGNEALVPRQFMLTANLHRQKKRLLRQDGASRLYACVDCGGCGPFCDHGTDVATTLADTRAELWEQGAAPSYVAVLMEHMRAEGRLPDRPQEDLLAPMLRGDGSEARHWLFLSCQNTASDLQVGQAAIELCRSQVGHTHVMAEGSGCCGKALWRWGDREGFAAHARRFAMHVEGAEKLVVDDDGCAHAFKALYPAVGVRLPEIVTLTTLVERALRQEPLVLPPEILSTMAPWDCCGTRRLGHPGVRQVMRVAAGFFAAGSVLEGEAGCCGGSLLPFYDASLAQKVAQQAAADALGEKGRRIVTNAPTCRRRLASTGAPVETAWELWHQARLR